MTAIVSILEDDVGHRERQAVQQADSVRYLNELNKVCSYGSQFDAYRSLDAL